jgi:alanyl-tRNA synthetase
MNMNQAKESGAVALFGEKYSDEVRVLSLGSFSKELCGGTHARRTGDIGLFKIIAEYGVASGVRRIEMVTGASALEWINQEFAILDDVAMKLKTSHDKVNEKLAQLIAEVKHQEKQLIQAQQKIAAQSGHTLLAEVQKIGDANVLVKCVDGQDAQGLRVLLDQLKSSLDSAVMVLYTVNDNKISVVAAVSKSLSGRFSAVELVKQLCGKGGGRDDMAQGGGEVPVDLAARLSSLRELFV